MYRNESDRRKIERALGYQFKDEKLLLQALTRRSALNEGRQESTIEDFQRLEFIGDRVLNLVVSDVMFENNPAWDEGRLTMEVSRFVNNKGPL
jgi:ribonuclease-3